MKNNERRQMNDSLLQNYRSNFIASQSLLIATGAMFYRHSHTIFKFIGVVALFQMALWARVIYIRALVVDFYEYDIGEQFNCNGYRIKYNERLSVDDYIKNRKIRERVNSALNHYRYRFDRTSFKVDVIMPISYFVLWLIMLFVNPNNL